MKDIAIIGGGASGLAAALCACECAERCSRVAPNVVIFEKDEKIARSILRSGNGRCNYSNAHIEAGVYHHPEFVGAALSSLDDIVEDAIGIAGTNPVRVFFERHGLVSREESEGRLYPATNKASTIVDILRTYLDCYGVDVQTDAKAVDVDVPSEAHPHFTIRFEDGRFERARKLIICSGGTKGRYGLDRLAYIDPVKMLGPLKTDHRYTKPLDNIRVRCVASLIRQGREVAHEPGEVIFRKYGLSGIAIFNLSRLAREGDTISLDLLPMFVSSDMVEQLQQRSAFFEAHAGRPCTYKDLFIGLLLPLVADQVMKRAHLDASEPVDAQGIQAIAHLVHAFDVLYEGIGDVAQCQVSRGGFEVESVDPRTCESYETKGLFITGEALDVDAPCGGYNLHWAFASGMLAGIACIRS